MTEWLPYHATLMQLARLRRESLDSLALRGVLESFDGAHDADLVRAVTTQLALNDAEWLTQPDAARCPFLCLQPGGEWSIVSAHSDAKGWSLLSWSEESHSFGEQLVAEFSPECQWVRLRLSQNDISRKSTGLAIVLAELLGEKKRLFEIVATTLAVNVLALTSAFYSLQVYDRVVPTAATSTLLVLTLGVLVAILFETLGKLARSRQLQQLTDVVDQRLARTVYARFLGLRLDQLPTSVGTMAQRMRGYESVRAFLIGGTTHLLIDMPMALLMLTVLWSFGGIIVIVPMSFALLGIVVGLLTHRRIQNWTEQAKPLQHHKAGLLVESIEGAETIKSGQGGWRMLSRWLDVTDESRFLEHKTRRLSERTQFTIGMLQQISYVMMIAFGAIKASQGELTTGGLVACSILSGRILGPIAAIPNQIVSWANTRSAVTDLDRLWELEQDHPDDVQPIHLEHLRGQYECDMVKVIYQNNTALDLPQLKINAGEKVGVIGSIGSGKTTLLKVLSGMFKPQEGRVRLDGIEIDSLAKSVLADHMGFVAQDGRLFGGTLRENLILGMADPGDDTILEVARRSGLFDLVIAGHPQGLERPIFEGGHGLSGGQRQLVHLTRALLREPTLWLLDEPTASMDQSLERLIIKTLQEDLKQRPQSTMILVTHKPQLLTLVDRLLVLGQGKIMLDGPRNEVIARMQNMAGQTAAKATTQNLLTALKRGVAA